MEEEQHCAISTQWQRSCQTDDETGQMRCETLKRTYRLCPGRQPEIVKEERVDEDGSGASRTTARLGQRLPLFGGMPSSPWSRDSAPPAHPPPAHPSGSFQMMEQMEQRMQAMMGSFGMPSFGLHTRRPPTARHRARNTHHSVGTTTAARCPNLAVRHRSDPGAKDLISALEYSRNSTRARCMRLHAMPASLTAWGRVEAQGGHAEPVLGQVTSEGSEVAAQHNWNPAAPSLSDTPRPELFRIHTFYLDRYMGR